jgi:putative tryptophan/tyrosine transport system substrate-binding protein
MRRRDFITLLGGAAFAWPLAVRAQQPAMPVIGFLHAATPSSYALAGLRQGLKEAGYVEGENVAVEYRWANNDAHRLPELAADLVHRRVDVIVPLASVAAALAAKEATQAISIVFGNGGDPVESGLVASLNRPGGNITGISSQSGELGGKQIGLLHQLLPHAVRFAILVKPGNPTNDALIRDAQAAALAVGGQIEVFAVSTNGEIDTAFANLIQKRTEALLITTDAFFADRRAQLVTLTARHILPSIYPFRDYAEAGGLMTYGPNLTERDRRVGLYVGRILKGEKPADLPIEQSSKFELVINAETAKALGLTIPPSVLAIADDVIE